MIDRSILSVLESAKAYAALVASFLTGLLALGVFPVPTWLAGVTVVLAWYATWRIPNAEPSNPVASRVEPEIEAP